MIVLDTHAWIWWLTGSDRLPASARSRIDEQVGTGVPVVVSSISVWELAMLVARGRLQLTMDVDDWVARAEAVEGVDFGPVDNRIALAAVALDERLHPDPADRVIVATASSLGASLVTGDRRLLDFDGVATLWA